MPGRCRLPSADEGNPANKPNALMELKEAIYHRRAVRNFTGAEVPRSMITELIDAAIQAPSAVNQQPWAFAVFEGRERLAEWSGRAKSAFLAGMPAEPDEHGLRGMLSDPSFDIFYNARSLVVVCATPGGMNPAEDCCLAAQNLMLAAHGMGLGTCPIGLARPWLNLPEVKSEIGLPADVSVVLPLIVGWPVSPPPPVPRREPSILVWA